MGVLQRCIAKLGPRRRTPRYPRPATPVPGVSECRILVRPHFCISSATRNLHTSHSQHSAASSPSKSTREADTEKYRGREVETAVETRKARQAWRYIGARETQSRPTPVKQRASFGSCLLLTARTPEVRQCTSDGTQRYARRARCRSLRKRQHRGRTVV